MRIDFRPQFYLYWLKYLFLSSQIYFNNTKSYLWKESDFPGTALMWRTWEVYTRMSQTDQLPKFQLFFIENHLGYKQTWVFHFLKSLKFVEGMTSCHTTISSGNQISWNGKAMGLIVCLT